MRKLRRSGARGIAFSRYLEQLINSENNLMVFGEDELVFQSQGQQAHHGAARAREREHAKCGLHFF